MTPIEYAERQRPLFGVHTIMMEKSAQLVWLDVHATPFTISTITYEVMVYAPAESVDTFPLSHLYPYMYSVVTLQSTTNTQPPTPDDYELTTVQPPTLTPDNQ